MEIEAMTRRWGNSIVVVIPADVVGKQKIKENEEVMISVKKKRVKAGELFGLLKGWKRPTQEIKDEMRAGWLSDSDRKREEEWKKKEEK
jgi:antitoxin component of MazEF toxin-antitoxin module